MSFWARFHPKFRTCWSLFRPEFFDCHPTCCWSIYGIANRIRFLWIELCNCCSFANGPNPWKIPKPDLWRCFNNNYDVMLTNDDWLERQLPSQEVARMVTFLKVRGISFSKHETDKYITIVFYLIRKNNNDFLAYIYIWRKLHS